MELVTGRSLGLYGQAQTELLAVLDTARQLLGPEHPDVLAARHQLARVLDKRGKHEQAETELTDVLDARRRVLGNNHPSTLATRNRRASRTVRYPVSACCCRPCACQTSARSMRVTVTARRRILGEDHPNTLTSRHNLASVLNQQGRRQPAEAEYRAVLDARCRVLGEDHPDTLATATALGTIDR